MKILLDTQVFIWLTNDSPKLSSPARQIVLDPDNSLYISYFSFFEMAIKASIGKLQFDASVITDLPKMGIELVMPDTKTLETYKIHNPANRDPYDNVLLTTALGGAFHFMTSDQKILAAPPKGLSLLRAS